MRNTTMLRAFTKAKVAKKSANSKLVGRLVNALQRATAPRPMKKKVK